MKWTTTITTAVAALAIGALVGSSLTGISEAQLQSETIEEGFDLLPSDNKEIRRKNARLRFISDLADEFQIDPQIVLQVEEEARRYVDPLKPEWRLVQTPEFMTHIMLSIIHAESNGRAQAIGDEGRARGLTQIWLTTAQQYGEVSAEDLLDPETNVKYSFIHFERLLKRYNGNLAMALYAWNRGEGTVDNLLRYGKSPSNGYGRKVYRASLAHRPADDSAGD